MSSRTDFERAAALDAVDPLARFRERFVCDQPELIYLDGNSLGMLPKGSRDWLLSEIDDGWGARLVRAWPERWIELPFRIGSKVAELIGAEPEEVGLCDSTTVNLFKLTVAALRARPDRTRIVTDDSNFPSDLYALLSAARTTSGCELRVVETSSPDVDVSKHIETFLDDGTALLALSHTAFKSGRIHDMRRLTDSAHRVGALTLWDLSHSVGAVPTDLAGCDADLAVGCTYKYLHGGPGAPAFLFVRKDLHASLLNPIWGWFGDRDPFEFGLEYRPAPGIRRFTVGTPPILSMVPVEVGVDLVLEAGMGAIRNKSILLTSFLVELWENGLVGLGVRLGSPRLASERGSHVAFSHPEGLRICKALIELENVVPDFRFPDNVRFGLSPLATSFQDVLEGVVRLERVISGRAYERVSSLRPKVT